ncbi:hypothetical protein HL653_06845 [Sphingomonas sp. AP4-R1]|uniref:hypothetical protein n=1 Tax=Sphingomonas sp. AP4-R1 TaxID=2735134 RepID=UPI001493A695|nr:hypothetical protein [Sphingomonas sp. AP4-R1]QJU57545.1 hypothetical protein HL653_06845 [Sphingomonas sp. AP4-R1]
MVTASAVMRAAVLSLGRIGFDGLAALLLVVIGTNLLDFLTAPAPGATPDAAFALAAIVRIGSVIWIGYVVQAKLVGSRAAFLIGTAFWRFAALQIAALLGMMLVRLIILRIAPPAPTLVGEWTSNLVGLAIWGLLSIRLLAWNAGLAADAPFGALGAIWRGQSGHDGAIAGAFIGLALPPAAFHLALTLVAVRMTMSPQSHVTIAVLDGLFSALQLALTCAIGAVALRLASRPEPR